MVQPLRRCHRVLGLGDRLQLARLDLEVGEKNGPQQVELGEDLVDVVALLAPQLRQAAQHPPHLLGALRRAARGDVAAEVVDDLGDVVEQLIGGEDAALVLLQAPGQLAQPAFGQLGGPVADRLAEVPLEELGFRVGHDHDDGSCGRLFGG